MGCSCSESTCDYPHSWMAVLCACRDGGTYHVFLIRLWKECMNLCVQGTWEWKCCWESLRPAGTKTLLQVLQTTNEFWIWVQFTSLQSGLCRSLSGCTRIPAMDIPRTGLEEFTGYCREHDKFTRQCSSCRKNRTNQSQQRTEPKWWGVNWIYKWIRQSWTVRRCCVDALIVWNHSIPCKCMWGDTRSSQSPPSILGTRQWSLLTHTCLADGIRAAEPELVQYKHEKFIHNHDKLH